MTADTPAPIETLLRQLALETGEDEDFVARASGGGYRLFGGLVAAQAVVAAGRTVRDLPLHSLHAYFLRPGRPDVDIRYAVSRIKEGRNFHARNVTAWQGEEIIFALTASFTRPEDGISHQDPMPEAPPPDDVAAYDGSDFFRRWSHGPVEMRECAPVAERPSYRRLWLRPRGPLPDDPLIHTAVLVYVSDRTLVSTGARRHRALGPRRGGASLDHAVWLHRPPRCDDWLLYTMESPVAHAARALALGALYDPRTGARVASVAQEGLLRFG